MVRNAPQVFDALEKNRLLGQADLENARNRWNKPDRAHLDSSHHCVKWLVTNHFITAFQGEQILEGKSESLRIDEFVVREKVADGPFIGGFLGQDSLHRQVIIQYGKQPEGGTGAFSTGLGTLQKTVSQLEKLENHHIQKALACGTHQGRPFIAWQWWDGCTLGTAMARKGKVEAHKACKIFATVLGSVQTLHEAGLPVGLIDLDSIFLAIESGRGEGRVVKLLKAGIGHYREDNAGQEANLTHSEEVYSIGKAMYQAVTGSAFPQGGKKRSPVASLAPDVPEHIADFLDQLTDPDPEIRFSDAKVAGKALRILIATEEGEFSRAQDQDPLAEVKPVSNAKTARRDSEEISEDEEDWVSSKINALLAKAGISPRELIFLSGGALATVMLLLLGLWLVGDIMPLIALGLGAMGGYYLNAWLGKRTQVE